MMDGLGVWGSGWFLACTPPAYAHGSSALLRAIKSPFSSVAQFVGLAAGWQPEFVFAVNAEPGGVRLVGVFPLTETTVTMAAQAMIVCPGVGVVLRPDQTPNDLKPLARVLFTGRGMAAENARLVLLRRLFVEPGGLCDGAVTVAGSFDDPQFEVEYFHYHATGNDD